MGFLGNVLVILALSWISLSVCTDETFPSTIIDTTTTKSTPTPPVTTPGTPKPTTPIPPEPKTSLWYVTDKDTNNTCILLEAGIRMIFNYRDTSTKIVSDFPVDIPFEGVNVSGSCDGSNALEPAARQQIIKLKFFDNWLLSLTLTMNQTEPQRYDVTRVTLNYTITPEHFPNADPLQDSVQDNVEMFVTDANKKYVCVASQTLMTKNNTVGLTTLTTYTLSLEAFRNSTSHVFTNNANHCPHDEVSQLVPIIVGAALAGLIVIVLIIYLIGRQRMRPVYESV